MEYLFDGIINEERLKNMSLDEMKLVWNIVKKIPIEKHYFSDNDIQQLIQAYFEKDDTAQMYAISEGCLLEYGLLILTADNLKTAIIRERYINEWQSGYSIRLYKVTPKKYQAMIDNY